MPHAMLARRTAAAMPGPRPPQVRPRLAPPVVQRTACSCGGTCPHCRATVAAAEREAEAFAARALGMDAADRSAPSPAQGGSGSAEATGADPLAGLGAGRPLPAAARAFFEPRLGRSLADVRVHDGQQAARNAEAVGAEAYAFGSDLVFGPGRFAPESEGGRRLLAHELAHVAQQDGAAALHRKPKDTPAPGSMGTMPASATPQPATDAERRLLIEGSIEFLNASAAFSGEPAVKVDAALFDRVLTSWYSMVVRQEELIDAHFAGDADLRARLRAAYSAALAVMLPKFAAASGTPEAEIWIANSGRIPMWAWPDPHRLAPGISTPLASAQALDPATGNATATIGGIDVTIRPDATDPALTDHAITRRDLRWTILPRFRTRGDQVIGIDPLMTPTLAIQTFYPPGITAAAASGYGRGTSAEDIAGAAITPRSATLGHHEGEHGLALQRFVAANPPPAFTAAASPAAPLARAAFDAAVAAHNAAMCAYGRRLTEFSFRQVDCVGTPKAGSQTTTRGAPCNDSFTMTC